MEALPDQRLLPDERLLPDQHLLTEIEAKAVEMARQAGEIVQGRFGKPLETEYKGKGKQDPVTLADKESQAYLSEVISRCFPDHGIVGEEDDEEVEAPAADFLWVLDPLDGTTNFLNGLPVYAVSIGVLYRGTPVAGALFVPWPSANGGVVLHARRGGGAWMEDEALSVPDGEGPEAGRLTGLPGSFGARFRVGKGLRRQPGEVRVTGSIAYELALAACGAFQYVVVGAARVWDIAAGVLVVTEAGGAVLMWQRKRRGWEPVTSLGPSWDGGPPTVKGFREWRATLIVGNPRVAPYVAANLRGRFPLTARVRRVLGKRRRRM